MSHRDAEFTVLRETIATRGTARMILLPVTIIAWGSLALVVFLFGDAPFAVLLPLWVLAGGFEAIHALHVGVERVGRYLQVNYENADAGPAWETTVTAVGPGLPGGGVDPLFSLVFAGAAFLNMIPALGNTLLRTSAGLPQTTRTELAVIGVLHLAFVVRVVRARGAAARQRAVELETFRAIQRQLSNQKVHTSNPNA
jgi:hypothetical protein